MPKQSPTHEISLPSRKDIREAALLVLGNLRPGGSAYWDEVVGGVARTMNLPENVIAADQHLHLANEIRAGIGSLKDSGEVVESGADILSLGLDEAKNILGRQLRIDSSLLQRIWPPSLRPLTRPPSTTSLG